MTDYDWYGKETIAFAVEGIRAEAKKWDDLARRMDGVRQQAAGQTLSGSAFAVTDLSGAVTTADLSSAYDKMHDWLTDLFRQATTEFGRFADALEKNADWYQHAEASSTQDFDAIAAGMPS